MRRRGWVDIAAAVVTFAVLFVIADALDGTIAPPNSKVQWFAVDVAALVAAYGIYRLTRMAIGRVARTASARRPSDRDG